MTTNPSPSLAQVLEQAGQVPDLELLPRDSNAATIAEWIQQRVADELRVPGERVDVTAPLKTLGVPSIAALTITGDLAEALDHSIPESFLWTHPTILAAAEALEEELRADPARDMQDPRLRAVALEAGLTERQYDALYNDSRTQPAPRAIPGSLLKIVRAGNDQHLPVVWIGSYQAVQGPAAQLPGRVYHGMPGWDRIPYKVPAAQALARVYLEELAAAGAARQPVVLAGFCWGARVALEMAAVLEARGCKVAHLVIIEYPGPSRLYRKLRRLHSIVTRPQPFRKGLEAMGRRLGAVGERGNGAERASRPDVTVTAARRNMQGNTRPLAYPTIQAPVTLLFGKQSYLSVTPDKTCGWRGHLPAATKLLLWEGPHNGLTHGKNAVRLGRLLRRRAAPGGV